MLKDENGNLHTKVISINDQEVEIFLLPGGGRMYEEPGTYSEGPWVSPDDEIKENVTYNCKR